MNGSRRQELTPERPEKGDAPEREIEDLAQAVQSVLTLRRWEARDGPFDGFGSPPGKF